MGKYDHIKTPKQAWATISRLRKIRRIPELENLLMQDAAASYNYAMKIIQNRWKEAEPNIIKNGNSKIIYLYAHNIIKARWPEAENKIIEGEDYIVEYAKNLIGERWKEAEKQLIEKSHKEINNTVHFWRFDLMVYCKSIIKDRWEEAEAVFSKNAEALLEYSKNILEDKLPENLHNLMLCNSLSENENVREVSKEYLDFVKQTEIRLKKQIKNRQISKEMKVEELLGEICSK